MRKMGPLAADHPLVMTFQACPACRHLFREGQFVTLVTIGPGEDPEERQKAREGHAYNAVASPVHWACATGEES